MKIRIKLFGGLRKYVGGRATVELYVYSQLSVREVIAALNIPDQFVYLVEKGGKAVDKNTIVEDEEEIKLLPVIAGG